MRDRSKMSTQTFGSLSYLPIYWFLWHHEGIWLRCVTTSFYFPLKLGLNPHINRPRVFKMAAILDTIWRKNNKNGFYSISFSLSACSHMLFNGSFRNQACLIQWVQRSRHSFLYLFIYFLIFLFFNFQSCIPSEKCKV